MVNAESHKVEIFEKDCQALRHRLLKVALRVTRNREDAEDAVQDCLMRAYLHIEEFQGNCKLSTWLMRIVMNSAFMINRRNRAARQVSIEDLRQPGEPCVNFQIPDRTPNPEQTYLQGERTRILYGAIRKLRPRMRAVVEVAQFQELPTKEIAKVLGISAAAAKSRLGRGRSRLRKSFALGKISHNRTKPRREFARSVSVYPTAVNSGVYSASGYRRLCYGGQVHGATCKQELRGYSQPIEDINPEAANARLAL